MAEGRPASWVLGAGLVAITALAIAGLLWWKLPQWSPELVVRYSPFVEPALRASWLEDGNATVDLLEQRIETWGASATPALVAWGRDPERRPSAIWLLLKAGDERAIPTVRTWLDDPQPEVAARALRLMTRLAPREIAAWLPAQVERRALGANEWTSACLDAIEELQDPALLGEAVRAAVEAGAYGPLERLTPIAEGEQVAALLDTGSTPERLAVLTVLDRSPLTFGDAVSAAVLRCAVASDRDIGREGLGLLPRLGRMALPTMGRVLLDADRVRAASAGIMLLEMGDGACLPYAARALREHPEEAYALSRLVASVRDPQADRILETLLESRSDLVRHVAVRALADGRSPSIANMGRLLGDADPGVRASAARLAGLIHARDLAPRIVALLADPEDVAAAEAAGALARLGDASVVPELATAAMSGREELQAAAIIALAGLDRERARSSLVACLANDDPELRALAIAGLLRGLPDAQRNATLAATKASVPDWLVREAEERLGDELGPVPTQIRSTGSP